MEQLIRPYGVVIDGELELGLELILEGDVIREIRPHTGIPEPFVVSPAFVNAHSHLEYRGLQGKLKESQYWPWIREITRAKRAQTPSEVERDCRLAALENYKTGVALIGEHSDRGLSAGAMQEFGIEGVIFQEVITRFEPEGPGKRLQAAEETRRGYPDRIPSFLIPHAYQTVDDATLREFGRSGRPISIHVAETDLENQLTLSASGAIADTFRDLGVPYVPTGKRVIETLDDLGLVRSGVQFVHCCAIDLAEIQLLAKRGVSVAHCPRSNKNLNCPAAPLREMLDAGVRIGLGLDSAASSGAIDMFAEMRAALNVSVGRGRPLTATEVWRMATTMGAESLRFALAGIGSWRIEPGATTPLIEIRVEDALSTSDLIERGTPARVKREGGWNLPSEPKRPASSDYGD